MREIIQKKLQERASEIPLLQKQIKESYQHYLSKTPGVKLARATKYQKKYLNPQMILTEDIVDETNKVLYPKNTKINPFKIKSLPYFFCFFDGDDKAQVHWVINKCGENQRNKLVMVAGDFSKLTSKFKRRFYFDQHAVLSKKLNLTALPAKVGQEGENVVIEEFYLE